MSGFLDNICNISVMAVIHGVSEGEGRRGEKNGLLLPPLIRILSTAHTHTYTSHICTFCSSYSYFLLLMLSLSTAHSHTCHTSFCSYSYLFAIHHTNTFHCSYSYFSYLPMLFIFLIHFVSTWILCHSYINWKFRL